MERKVNNLFSNNFEIKSTKIAKTKEKKYIKPNKLQKSKTLLQYLILLSFFIIILSKDNYNSITLKINKSGNRQIYHLPGRCSGDNVPPEIDEVYINGINQSEINSSYNLVKEVNIITLVWRRDLYSTSCMFVECNDIEEIDLSNLDTSKVTNMHSMFYGCESLKSLDVSNFNISQVSLIDSMFNGCKSLISLNLYSFDSSKVTDLKYMFMNCEHLIFLNLENFGKSNQDKVFEGTSDNLIICTSLDNNNWDYLNWNNQLALKCAGSNKSYRCHKKTSNAEINKYLCLTCGQHFYRNHSDLSSDVVCNEINEGYYLNKNDDDPQPQKCYSTCKICDTGGDETNHNCIECDNNYNYILIISDYKKCLNQCEYYHYTDNITNKTYCTFNSSCPNNYNKLIKIKNECIDECFKDSEFIYEYQNECYDKYPYSTQIITTEIKDYISNTLISYNISSDNTGKNEISYNLSNNLISSEIFTNINDEIYNSHIFYNKSNSKEITVLSTDEINESKNTLNTEKTIISTQILTNEFSYKEKINVISSILSSSEILINENINISLEFEIQKNNFLKKFNKTLISEGTDIELNFQNILLTLSSTENQKNNANINKTSIHLKECENILKNEYNISLNEVLYILKLNKKEEGMKIPKVEYEIYYPFDTFELKKLNLSKCKNSKVDIFYPVNINNNEIDKYNPSGKYYNDICSKIDSDSKMDITLSDRRNEFIDNNMTLCEED